MSRKLCCICLALSVFISTVSIAYADSTSITHPTAEDYRQAVAYLETAGLQTGLTPPGPAPNGCIPPTCLQAARMHPSRSCNSWRWMKWKLSSRPSRPPGSSS